MPGIYGGVLGAPEPPRRIVDAQATSYASSRHLLFVRGGTLFAQVFDPVDSRSRAALSLSPSRSSRAAAPVPLPRCPPLLLARSRSAVGRLPHSIHFVWFDQSGAPLETIPGSDLSDGYNSSLSPDASRLATSSRVEGTADVWLLDVKRGVSTRFTTDPVFDLMPVWSPDGHWIAFTSNRRGSTEWAFYMQSTDGTGNDELLVANALAP